MKIKKHILKYFSFLQNKGFILEYSTYYNIFYKYSFISADNCKIIITIDLREHFVNLKIKKDTKVLLEIVCDKFMENHNFDKLKETIDSLKSIYNEAANSKRGFSTKHIEAILDLYAKFILINFLNIN